MGSSWSCERFTRLIRSWVKLTPGQQSEIATLSEACVSGADIAWQLIPEKAVSGELAERLALEIRVLLDELEMSQADLARSVGVSQAAISRFLKGGGVSLPTLDRMCEALDVDLVFVESVMSLENEETTGGANGKTTEKFSEG